MRQIPVGTLPVTLVYPTDATAQQLTDKAAYVRAVLGPEAATHPTTRPYDGQRPAAPAPKKEHP